MGARSVLILAELADSERALIEQDCENCNFDVTWLSSADMLGSKLISGKFDTLVVHLQTPGAARASVEARNALSRVRFPIMALADRADDSTFNKAFRVGADDVVHIEGSAQISQRLAAIPKASWKPSGRMRGEALIIDPDRARADALARLLKEAGFLVKSVRDAATAKLHLGRPSVRLVVTDDATVKVPPLIGDGNRRDWRPVWIVRARPDQMDLHAAELAEFHNASVVNAYLSANDVLYEANRLRDEPDTKPRFLHGTTVKFSAVDSNWHEYGFSYALGVDSLMVRTLALPPAGELRLELSAPSSDQPLSLIGELSERRVFGPLETQTGPPGFSVRLVGGDLERWHDLFAVAFGARFGKAHAAAANAGSSSSKEPPASTPVARIQLGVSARAAEGSEQPRRMPAPTLKSIVSPETPTGPQSSEAPRTTPGVAPAPPTSQELSRQNGSGADEKRASLGSGSLERVAPAERAARYPRTRLGLGPGSNPKQESAADDTLGPLLDDASAVKPVPAEGATLEPPSASTALAPPPTEKDAPASAAAADGITVGAAPPSAASPNPASPSAAMAAGRTTLMSAPDEAELKEPSFNLDEALVSEEKSEVREIDRPRQAALDPEPTLALEPSAPDASESQPRIRPERDAPKTERDAARTERDRADGERPPRRTSKRPHTGDADRNKGREPRQKSSAPTQTKRSSASARPTASAHAAPESQAPRETKRSNAMLWAIGLLGVLAVVAFVSLQPTPKQHETSPAPGPTLPEPGVVPTPPVAAAPTPAAPSKAAPGSQPQVAKAPDAAPVPNVAPSADAGPRPTAAEAPSAAEAPAAAGDPAALPAHLGYLFVASSLDTQVFVQGKLAGQTNTPLKAFCGTRYVRLGTAPGHWQSRGVTVRILCQKSNRVELEPR